MLAAGLLALAALLVGVAAAEMFLRLFVSPPLPLGRLSYATADGMPITATEAAQRGLLVPVPPPVPRPRLMFAPGQSFYLCYSDQDVLRRPWFDDQGRVLVRINRFGLREREDLSPDKPAGQRRIVCIGDSFTFGWGIPEESCWVRLLERELCRSGADVRTVNCGAAGAVCVDEYWWGLKERFHVFQPDVVILTICLNDLIPSSGLNVQDPVGATGSRFVDLLVSVFGRSALDLDPGFDWVGQLLELPRQQGEAAGFYDDDRPFEAMWSQGVPQRSLAAAAAWCRDRKIVFLVVLWPFLQGLGTPFYPFQKLHDLVAAECKNASIPLLDVLPALRDTPSERLWVTPNDPHANPLAQQLVMPLILGFVAEHLQ